MPFTKKTHTEYNIRCIMYYSLKNTRYHYLIRVSDVYLIPIRSPSLSLLAIQKPQAIFTRSV
ncbi:hypothetical protein Hanom_Chr03g00194971 [Helianthus anomalus]